jgi:transcriptional regulator NrdR family protein
MSEANDVSKPAARGIECPTCACRHFRIVYTRRGHGGQLVRRRECRHCGRRVTTIEKLAP